jgi:hypothetical protein
MPDIQGDEDASSRPSISEKEKHMSTKGDAELVDGKDYEDDAEEDDEGESESETSSVVLLTAEGTPTTTTTGKKRIDVPDSGDVLFGRGKPYQNHGGNTVSFKKRETILHVTHNHTDTHILSFGRTRL